MKQETERAPSKVDKSCSPVARSGKPIPCSPVARLGKSPPCSSEARSSSGLTMSRKLSNNQDSFQEMVSNAKMTFGQPPSMLISPKVKQSTIFFENDKILLKVKIFDAEKVTWRKDGNNIFHKKGPVSIVRRPYFTLLQIKRAKLTDAGIYTLDLENMFGKESINFLVQVNVKEQLQENHNI